MDFGGGCSKNANAFGHLFNGKAVDILGGRLHDAMTDVRITACLFRRMVLRIHSNTAALGCVQNTESHRDTEGAESVAKRPRHSMTPCDTTLPA
jgi:hypothetical protein